MTHEDDQIARLKNVLYDNNIPKTLAISPLSRQMYAAGLRAISPDALAVMEELREAIRAEDEDPGFSLETVLRKARAVLAHGYPDSTPARAACAADGMDDHDLGNKIIEIVEESSRPSWYIGKDVREMFTPSASQSTVPPPTEATAPKDSGAAIPEAAGGCPAPGSKIYCGAEGCAGVPWMVPYLQTAPLTQEDLDWAETDVDRIEAQRAAEPGVGPSGADFSTKTGEGLSVPEMMPYEKGFYAGTVAGDKGVCLNNESVMTSTVPIPLEALWNLRYVLDQQYTMARDYASPLIPAIRAVLLAAGVITTDGWPVPATPEYAAWADARMRKELGR